jgi:hypothetical protein
MDVVSRARNIVMTPQAEWPVIAAEPLDVTELYTGYIVILAAIPLVAGLISQMVAGNPFGRVLMIAIVGYVLALINVAVIAAISSKLAPYFGGTDNISQGFKLAAYAATPVWLGGVFLLLPWIGLIARVVCGIYGLYLFYLGIPELMQVPPARRVGFLIAVVIAAIIVTWIIALILLTVTGLPMLLLH